MIELIFSAIQAIMQVMVIVIAGVIFANKGYVDNDKQKWLSKINLMFFTPCLLFANIASVISFESLLEYWPIPAFYLVFTFTSWFLCRITLPIFNIEKYYKRFITACVMFSNVNSLPVAIVASLAVSEAGKTLYWKQDDDESIVSARGIAYALFFGLFCNLLRWSLGYNLLQKKEEDEDTLVDDNSIYTTTSYGTINSKEISIDLEAYKPPLTKTSIMATLDKYMSPPLYAALLAMIVGLCPALKNLFYSQDSFLYGSFTTAIQNCGKASVPLTLFCLGAQLKNIRETQQTQVKSQFPIFLTIFLRMIITPMVVLPIVYLFAKYGSRWSGLASDPMFIVSMVIVGCTPTSINLAQITQVSGVYEEEMLSVLFWSYGVVCVPVCTLVVFLGLYMVNP